MNVLALLALAAAVRGGPPQPTRTVDEPTHVDARRRRQRPASDALVDRLSPALLAEYIERAPVGCSLELWYTPYVQAAVDALAPSWGFRARYDAASATWQVHESAHLGVPELPRHPRLEPGYPMVPGRRFFGGTALMLVHCHGVEEPLVLHCVPGDYNVGDVHRTASKCEDTNEKKTPHESQFDVDAVD